MNSDVRLTREELSALLREDADPPSERKHGLKLKLALDFPLEVSVRLGQARRNIGELLKLSPGTVIELDKGIGETVELVVNGRVIARGEVVTQDEHFAVRVTSIIKPEERVENLGVPGPGTAV